MGNEKKTKCPCCGFYTFRIGPDSEYDICPVCYWENDKEQNEDEDYEGGANNVSLNQARENYAAFGACEERFIDKVRDPIDEEMGDEDEEDPDDIEDDDYGDGDEE